MRMYDILEDKAAGRALSAACALNPRIEGVLPSTKGTL